MSQYLFLSIYIYYMYEIFLIQQLTIVLMRLITVMIMQIVPTLDQEPLAVNALMVIWVMVLSVNVSKCVICCN